MRPIEPISPDSIRQARERIAATVLRTPLVPLPIESGNKRIWLKLENLQPIGSFKIRGAGNAMAIAGAEALQAGVLTASAGNMAQGVAWNARRLGIPCRVVVPEHAPDAKLEAIERLGAETIRVPFDDWWRVMEEHRFADVAGFFVHPVCDEHVIAGNGTIGLEIVEDLPQVDTILVPFGGGGLSCGIASAAPRARVLGCEVATAAPLCAALEAGTPCDVDYQASFVDGIGSKRLLAPMWPLIQQQLRGAVAVSLEQVADAIRLLATRAHIVAEGAGAVAVAAALDDRVDAGNIVCVVSGGNIDASKLAAILDGKLP